jgi:hypothetical protein
MNNFTKLLIINIFFIINSEYSSGQTLPNSQLTKIILTVEAYLNNEVTPYNDYTIISMHEWNKEYHNGYSNIHKDFCILSYPYEELFNINEITENKIIISISPDSNYIIVQIYYQQKYYGFYSSIIITNGRKYLENIPYEINEND